MLTVSLALTFLLSLQAHPFTEGLDPATLPPIIIPGTRTAVNQLQQCRRWLLNERDTDNRGFSKSALEEAQRLFNKEYESSLKFFMADADYEGL